MTGEPPRQPSGWPLLMVAALSFVPGFGLMFAAGAVTWGLVSRRRHARLAIGVAAAGTLLNVAAALVLMRYAEQQETFKRVEVAETRTDLNRLVLELEHYRARAGRYPPNLQLLIGIPIPTHLINIYDHSQGMLRLPRLYEYHVSSDGSTYDLFAVGPDGVPHTADDVRPDFPDSASRHSGYRPAP